MSHVLFSAGKRVRVKNELKYKQQAMCYGELDMVLNMVKWRMLGRDMDRAPLQ